MSVHRSWAMTTTILSTNRHFAQETLPSCECGVYGPGCGDTCDPFVSCSGNGFCLGDGSCQCVMGYVGKYCNVSARHFPRPSKRIDPEATGKQLIQKVTRISNFKDKELLAGMQQTLPKHQTDIPFWIHEIHTRSNHMYRENLTV
jgi:hypothetical protein